MVAQGLAVAIFVAMFVLIVMDKFGRQYITLGCGALTLIGVFGICMRSVNAIWEIINLRSIFTPDFWYQGSGAAESGIGINWETVIFIACMMIMVEGMARVGFFDWLCMRIAKMVHFNTIPIFITFMIMSAVLAMFIDSITVILFLAAVTIELSQLLEFDPVPMILSEIFCANLGGSATMCGDPPNIIIGTSLGYSFSDFLGHTGVIAIVCLLVILVYFYLIFKKELSDNGADSIDTASLPSPESAIVSKKGFIVSTVIFLLAVVLLVSHASTGLTVSCIGTFIAAITLITSGKNALTLIKKIDYHTLLFFIGLFVVVGGLEQTGVLVLLANLIGKICGGNLYLMIAIIVWVSAVASAFIDNIPFAATMIPVINSLAATQGVDLSILAWSLAMGTDIGGSATPIGASANVVGVATAAKSGHIIKWGRYCKAMVPATVIVMIIATIMICVRYVH